MSLTHNTTTHAYDLEPHQNTKIPIIKTYNSTWQCNI